MSQLIIPPQQLQLTLTHFSASVRYQHRSIQIYMNKCCALVQDLDTRRKISDVGK